MDRAGGIDEQLIHEFGHALFAGVLGLVDFKGDRKVIQVSNVYRRFFNSLHKNDKNFIPLKMRSGIGHRNDPETKAGKGDLLVPKYSDDKKENKNLNPLKTPPELSKT
jgi:hypothetical protein